MSIANNQFELQIAPEQKQFDLSMFEVNKETQTVNLTKIAQHFNKRIDVWLKSKNTKAFIQAYSAVTPNGGIRTLSGFQGEQGTFGDRKVSLKFAQWISPEFEIYCLEKLDILFQEGKAETPPAKFTNLQIIEMAREAELGRLKAESQLAQANLQLETNKPKVEYAQQMESSVNAVSIDSYARKLDPKYNLGEIKLYEWLRSQKICCTDPWNAPAQRYIGEGYFEYKPNTFESKNGKVFSYSTCKITGKGQIWLTNKIAKTFSNQLQVA